METVTIDGVELSLGAPDELAVRWVGQDFVRAQLEAAWWTRGPGDLPMNPRLLGRPGVGKTALAYAAAKALGRDVYLMQATMDTRPEDLLVTPVLAAQGRLRYVASGLVTAMIRGGVCILDEGNRMTEKAWASLAPLLDTRRYVESVVAGIKVKAHPEFRFCSTMNEDASTFEIPEYIQTRLQPRIVLDFPDAAEERAILAANLPHAEADLLDYLTEFLQAAHAADERFTVRDGVNIGRYAIKLGAAQDAGALGPIPDPDSPGAGTAWLRFAGADAEGVDLERWFKDALAGVLGAAAPGEAGAPGAAGSGDPAPGDARRGRPEGAGAAAADPPPPPGKPGPKVRALRPGGPATRARRSPYDGTGLVARVRHAARLILGDEAAPYLPRADRD